MHSEEEAEGQVRGLSPWPQSSEAPESRLHTKSLELTFQILSSASLSQRGLKPLT